jgi:hypothetical protein
MKIPNALKGGEGTCNNEVLLNTINTLKNMYLSKENIYSDTSHELKGLLDWANKQKDIRNIGKNYKTILDQYFAACKEQIVKIMKEGFIKTASHESILKEYSTYSEDKNRSPFKEFDGVNSVGLKPKDDDFFRKIYVNYILSECEKKNYKFPFLKKLNTNMSDEFKKSIKIQKDISFYIKYFEQMEKDLKGSIVKNFDEYSNTETNSTLIPEDEARVEKIIEEYLERCKDSNDKKCFPLTISKMNYEDDVPPIKKYQANNDDMNVVFRKMFVRDIDIAKRLNENNKANDKIAIIVIEDLTTLDKKLDNTDVSVVSVCKEIESYIKTKIQTGIYKDTNLDASVIKKIEETTKKIRSKIKTQLDIIIPVVEKEGKDGAEKEHPTDPKFRLKEAEKFLKDIKEIHAVTSDTDKDMKTKINDLEEKVATRNSWLTYIKENPFQSAAAGIGVGLVGLYAYDKYRKRSSRKNSSSSENGSENSSENVSENGSENVSENGNENGSENPPSQSQNPDKTNRSRSNRSRSKRPKSKRPKSKRPKSRSHKKR